MREGCNPSCSSRCARRLRCTAPSISFMSTSAEALRPGVSLALAGEGGRVEHEVAHHRIRRAHHLMSRRALRAAAQIGRRDRRARSAREGSLAEMPPASSPATRMPSCVPGGIEDHDVREVGRRLGAARDHHRNDDDEAEEDGAERVLKMNHFERTRSRYSRLMTTKSLSMAGHPRLDARGADRVEEDLVERRLHELEALDDRAGVDEPCGAGAAASRSARARSRRSGWSRRASVTSERSAKMCRRRRRERSSPSATAMYRPPRSALTAGNGCRRAPSRRAR